MPPDRSSWPPGALEALQQWQQGDVVRDPPFFYFADPARAVWEATRAFEDGSPGPEVIVPEDDHLPGPDQLPRFGLVTTQTCDIGEEDAERPLRPWVQVAPIYKLTDWRRSRLQGSRGPRYWLLLPSFPEPGVWVADFRIEVPVEKGWLSNQERIQAFGAAEERWQVGKRVAYLRSRPAFNASANMLQSRLFSWIKELDEVGSDGASRFLTCLVEVAIKVDDHEAPTTVQFVFLLSSELPGECEDILLAWNRTAADIGEEVGVTVQACDVRLMSELPLAEYRRMTRVW
jgi:hypothetical protein